MAFTVYDPDTDDFNSYASVEEADAYCEDRAITAWTAATDEAKEPALIRATDFIYSNYAFRSTPFPGGVIEPALVKATIELAVHALSVDLGARQDERDIDQSAKELDGVGSISLTYGARRDRFPMVTAILAPIASRIGGGVATSRMLK